MKFAYLIMAHDNPEQLGALLSLLDDSDNDLYLHIDKKNVQLSKIDWAQYVSHSHIECFSEFSIRWGGISQTKCQMFLLKEALKRHHDYYHLISGKDLPLKTNREISNFFKEHKDEEFVYFEDDAPCRKETVIWYHFFGYPHIEKQGAFLRNTRILLDRIVLKLQKVLGINRKFYCGDNWYSITERLAADFSANEKQLLHRVRFSINSDEIILQTFLYPLLSNYHLFYNGFDCNHISIMRYIDWDRGSPYVWTSEDYDELIASPYLWARKFDENVDAGIIERIKNTLITASQNES